MLPKTFAADRDLILSVSLSRGTFATTNIHPLYLSPAVCWINRAHESARMTKVVVVNIIKVVSSVLMVGTLFAHMVRLWDLFTLGLVRAAWSITVCLALGAGIAVTVTSPKLRSSRTKPVSTANPLAGVPLTHRILVFALFCAAYVHTWLYYAHCCKPDPCDKAVSVDQSKPWTGCLGNPRHSRRLLVASTVLTFVWINVIGSLRMIGFG